MKGRDRRYLVTSLGFLVHSMLRCLLQYPVELLLWPFACVSSSRGSPVWMKRHFSPATSQRLRSESNFWQLLEPWDFRVVHRAGKLPNRFVPVVLFPFLDRKNFLPLTSPPSMKIYIYSSILNLNWKLI